jgi:hypothetical protein
VKIWPEAKPSHQIGLPPDYLAPAQDFSVMNSLQRYNNLTLQYAAGAINLAAISPETLIESASASVPDVFHSCGCADLVPRPY